MKFFASCPKGLEYLLVDELLALGCAHATATTAGANVEGTLHDAQRAVLWSRFASRVLWPIADYACENEDALYAGARAIDWTAHLDPTMTLATPEWLFLSTGIRAVDHCVEGICSAETHPYADAQALHADAHQALDLGGGEQLGRRTPIHPLGGHAVGAAQVALVGQGDAQIGGPAPEGVHEPQCRIRRRGLQTRAQTRHPESGGHGGHLVPFPAVLQPVMVFRLRLSARVRRRAAVARTCFVRHHTPACSGAFRGAAVPPAGRISHDRQHTIQKP